MNRITKTALTILAALGLLVLAGCTVDTPSDGTLVHKGGGIVEAASPKGCVTPGTREMQKPGDSYYMYPVNQRYYSFSPAYQAPSEEGKAPTGADGPPITVVSKDGQTLSISGTLSFNLNTNCDVLQRFHDNVGNREHAYFDSTSVTPAGWVKMLNTYMRPAIDSTLDRVAKQYEWRQLYSDVTIKDTLNSEVNRTIKELVNERFTGTDDYFVNYSSLILQPQADQALVDAVKANETSKAQAQATETKAKADAAAAEAAAKSQVSQKQAELKVAQIEAEIEAQKIAPYGSVREYNNFLLIQKGGNPYQPTYGGGVIVDPNK